MKKLRDLSLRCNVRLCLPMIQCFSSLERLTLTDQGPILCSAKPFSLSKLINLQSLTLKKCASLGTSLPELPLNLERLYIYNHTSLEQLPDLSILGKLRQLQIKGCINLQSISFLPSHLGSLSVEECPSLRDVPDLSMLKELEYLSFTGCNNLKSRSLEQSFVQGNRPFEAHLPNTEVAEWFNYKSSGHTVSFVIPPSFESNFLGLALWVVYTCKAKKEHRASCMTAVIRNETEGITEKYSLYVQPVVGEAQSTVKCIRNLSVKSGDRIQVSFSSLLYSLFEVEIRIGEVKVNMCGVHVMEDRPPTSVH